jgi:hypothetical protein
MPAQASMCSQCRAPLPATTGLVTCAFCGTANVVQGPVGTTQIRAVVRKVLSEGTAAPMEPNTKLAWIASGVFVIVGLIVLPAVVALFSFEKVSAIHRPVDIPPQNSPLVIPRVPIARPPEAKPMGLGTPLEIALGDRSDLFIATSTHLIKADRKTLRSVWMVPLDVGVRGSSDNGDIVVGATRVAVAGPSGVAFFDSATGAALAKFLFKTDGFKVSACLADGVRNQVAEQLLAKTTFDGTLRFDMQTGARVSGNTSCVMHGDIHCGPKEQCGFGSTQPPGLDCRYYLQVGESRVTVCEEEGTKARLLVKRAKGLTQWKTVRGTGAATNPDFMSTIGGFIVVAENHFVEAFDAASGQHRWIHALEGDARALVSDGQQLFFGSAGTVVAVDAATGLEVARFLRTEE